MEATEFAKLRGAAKMTQREVAILFDVTERTIWRWETGEGKIPHMKADFIRNHLRAAAKKTGR